MHTFSFTLEALVIPENGFPYAFSVRIFRTDFCTALRLYGFFECGFYEYGFLYGFTALRLYGFTAFTSASTSRKNGIDGNDGIDGIDGIESFW